MYDLDMKERKMVTLGDSKVSFISRLSTPPSFVTCGTRVWEHGQKMIGFYGSHDFKQTEALVSYLKGNQDATTCIQTTNREDVDVTFLA